GVEMFAGWAARAEETATLVVLVEAFEAGGGDHGPELLAIPAIGARKLSSELLSSGPNEGEGTGPPDVSKSIWASSSADMAVTLPRQRRGCFGDPAVLLNFPLL